MYNMSNFAFGIAFYWSA
uniref:Uncharacterized protein n=1 Tax=Anguilla anguilla TaxID=7936 RepID=A0A0E9XT17_ANGAN